MTTNERTTMSLFDVKTKEIIFNPSPLGNRVLMHDYRSVRKAEKMLERAFKAMPYHMPLYAEDLYKMIISTSLFDPQYQVKLEHVG